MAYANRMVLYDRIASVASQCGDAVEKNTNTTHLGRRPARDDGFPRTFVKLSAQTGSVLIGGIDERRGTDHL